MWPFSLPSSRYRVCTTVTVWALCRRGLLPARFVARTFDVFVFISFPASQAPSQANPCCGLWPLASASPATVSIVPLPLVIVSHPYSNPVILNPSSFLTSPACFQTKPRPKPGTLASVSTSPWLDGCRRSLPATTVINLTTKTLPSCSPLSKLAPGLGVMRNQPL